MHLRVQNKINNYMVNETYYNKKKTQTFKANTINATGIKAAQESIIGDGWKELKNIPLFKDIDTTMLGRFLDKLKLIPNVEYRTKGDKTNLFLKGKNFVYNMILTAAGVGGFSGVVSKQFNDGKDEIYIMQAEMYDTNKSDKLDINYMQVVQNGVNDNSPIVKKNIVNENIHGTESSKSVVSGHTITNEATQSAFFGLLKNHIENTYFIPDDINTKTNFDIMKYLSFADGKRTATLTHSKVNDEINMSGAKLASVTHAANDSEIREYIKKGYRLVDGPNNSNIYVPDNLYVDEDGLDLKFITSPFVNVALGLPNIERCYLDRLGADLVKAYPLSNKVNTLQDVENLIKRTTARLNQLKCSDSCYFDIYVDSHHNSIDYDNLIAQLKNILDVAYQLKSCYSE